MPETLPAPLLTQQTESSRCSVGTSARQCSQSQLSINISSHSVETCKPQQVSERCPTGEGMNCRKRCDANNFISDYHQRPQTIGGAGMNADAPLTRSQISTISPLNKKRRIVFSDTEVKKRCSVSAAYSEIERSIMTKHSGSCTSLPSLCASPDEAKLSIDGSTTGELDLNVSPATFVKTILIQTKRIAGPISGEDIISVASQRVAHDLYFISLSEEEQVAYDAGKVNAVQSNDLETLRSLFNSGDIMQTSNRFGESLLHTACRRGFTEVVDFFMNEARVCPRVRDDMGRTPMHDACWSSAPPNHRVMEMLIKAAPELLLSKDSRGHSPFDYARREHWPNWVRFLNENRQFIVDSLLLSCLETSDHAQVASSRTDDLRREEETRTRR